MRLRPRRNRPNILKLVLVVAHRQHLHMHVRRRAVVALFEITEQIQAGDDRVERQPDAILVERLSVRPIQADDQFIQSRRDQRLNPRVAVKCRAVRADLGRDIVCIGMGDHVEDGRVQERFAVVVERHFRDIRRDFIHNPAKQFQLHVVLPPAKLIRSGGAEWAAGVAMARRLQVERHRVCAAKIRRAAAHQRPQAFVVQMAGLLVIHSIYNPQPDHNHDYTARMRGLSRLSFRTFRHYP